MQQHTNRQTIVFRIDTDEYDAVKVFAAANGSSIQQFLTEAVRAKLGVTAARAGDLPRDTSFLPAALVFAELTKRRNYGVSKYCGGCE